MEITCYPHQKIVTIEKYTCDRNHPYIVCNRESLVYASNTLSHSALKIYLFLLSVGDKKSIALSYSLVNKTNEMSKPTYHKAVKELVSKGFLVDTNGHDNYVFLESPEKQDANAYHPKIFKKYLPFNSKVSK